MMDRNDIYDVIIIGCGSVGTTTALYLSESGLRTLIIDKNPSPGQGSNKSAIGGIRATHSDAAKIKICQRSIEIFSTWHKYYGDDIEWSQGGYSFVAYQEREEATLKNLLKTQHNFGLNINWYEKSELLKIIPDLNHEGLIGGTYSPEDGSASPLLSIHSFYTHACRLGATFHFNEKVIDILILNGKVVGVKTDRGEYHTGVIINAAGAWANQIANLVGMTIPVTPDSHESGITEPVAQFLKPMVVDIRPESGSTNFYFYQHATGQIVFCLTPSPSIWGYDTRETSNFLPLVARRMIQVMPRLRNIRVRRTWRGLYPMTPDGTPLVGWAKEPKGYLLAVGMCGQGFMLAPGLAELLTRIINNNLTKEDTDVMEILSPYRTFAGQELLK
jgi:sarcosine oxidase, subunit beta